MSGDFYPMPAFSTFEVGDVSASVRFYETALGFQTVFAMPDAEGAPLFVHLRRSRYADLLVRRGSAPNSEKGVGVTLTYAVPISEIDACFDTAKSANANVLQPLGDRPWNARDFTVADPDGFRVTLTAGPVNAALSLDQVVVGAPGKP